MLMLLLLLMLLPVLLLFRLLVWLLMLLMLLLLLQSGVVGPDFVAFAAPAEKPREKRSSSRNPVVLAETSHEGITLLAVAVVLFF